MLLEKCYKHRHWPNISANDPDPGLGSKGIDPVFLLFFKESLNRDRDRLQKYWAIIKGQILKKSRYDSQIVYTSGKYLL